MNNNREEHCGEGSSSRFHIVQPLRDLQSNWAVDLSKNLEEYLLKICSGEITGDDDDHHSVNFAEAALLLQGSIQVYSRKVEYLYTLVLHTLEFISQKRQQDQPEKTSDQPEGSDSHAVGDEENELFLGLDDVPVEPKNCLDFGLSKDGILNHYVKPPVNLVVLEGDCLGTADDAGELESYLLATNGLYRDFLLLDPCDAVAINDFLEEYKAAKGHNVVHRGSSLRSKTRKSFQSPTRQSGGTAQRSHPVQGQDVNLNRTPEINCNLDDFPVPENDHHGDEMDGGYSEFRYDSDGDSDDDPWKPLNPHEPGTLKIKPFKKVKVHRKRGINSTKRASLTTQFPLARLHGTISPELTETWEAQNHSCERLRGSDSPPLYEKLRQSLMLEERETCNDFNNSEDEHETNEYDNHIPDFGQADVNMPERTYKDDEILPYCEPHDDDGIHFDDNEACRRDDPNSNATLEDLCRSHLDALLASLAETEKQTELATRVSTWKQRIEHTLEEQDARPPFDIHKYGENILNKLSPGADIGGGLSFADVVRGQEKHDVARTFSALLQLVNNRNVDLNKGESEEGKAVCYTAVNPFYVQLLSHDKGQDIQRQFHSSKKRTKSPPRKGCTKADRDQRVEEKLSIVGSSSRSTSMVKSSQPSGKFKVGGVRCTPEGKKRRKSRLIEPVDL